VVGPFLGATRRPQSLTHDVHFPSDAQPSSMISPVVQSRTAHTGKLRRDFDPVQALAITTSMHGATSPQSTRRTRGGSNPRDV
jgi:hypothetical protein